MTLGTTAGSEWAKGTSFCLSESVPNSPVFLFKIRRAFLTALIFYSFTAGETAEHKAKQIYNRSRN